MANAEQILTLIKSHVGGDDDRFRTTALQIAAMESKAGHGALSRLIKEAIEGNGKGIIRRLTPINAEFSDMILPVKMPFKIEDLISSEEVNVKINRIIREYVQREKLAEFNLGNRRKILLSGPSGTGKTMTASILGNELHLPLYVVLMEKVITKFMGESSLKLSRVFEVIADVPGVYLFDEFDAIGSQRGLENEVGEQRRILNTFLQLMERDDSESIIVAATNSAGVLDKALFRRFDDVVEYNLPNPEESQRIIYRQLGQYLPTHFDISSLLPLFDGMSHAEITMVCKDILKESLLNDTSLNKLLIEKVVTQQYSAYKGAV
jgi:SpoVK/Ycf46/Vps4 family AAA+-type ATPase